MSELELKACFLSHTIMSTLAYHSRAGSEGSVVMQIVRTRQKESGSCNAYELDTRDGTREGL